MTASTRLMIIDVSKEGGGTLGISYRAGAVLFAVLRGGLVAEVKSTADVYAALGCFKEGELAELQIVGHGWAGRPMIGLPKALWGKDWDTVKPYVLRVPRSGTIDGKPFNPWRAVKGGVIWFRSCSVGQGTRGKNFVNKLAALGINVACHLCPIGYWGLQSYLVGACAGKTAWWPDDLKPGRSHPSHPRWIAAPQMTLPPWAFDHGWGIANA